MSRNTYMGGRDSYPGLETLRGKFIFEDTGDVWSVSDDNGHESHADLTATDAGTGLVALTFPAGRKAGQFFATIDARTTTQASQRECRVAMIDLSAGTATIIIDDLADTQADPVDESHLHVTVELTAT